MMLLNPRRWLRQLKPTFFTLICIGALILLRNLAYDNSVYQSISLHQKMEYQIFSSFYQKDENVRRVFRKKVAHLNELGLSNVHDNIPVQDDIVCRHPKLDLSNDANKAAFYDVGSIQCFGRELFTFKNGVLRFNKTSLRRDVIKKCSYQAVERIDDNYATYTTPMIRNSSPFDMVLQHDFIRIQCYFEIEEHTEYQRNLLSVNSQHGKRLLSIPERKPEKNDLEDGVQHGDKNNGVVQFIQESGTVMTRKKMTRHLKRSPFTPPKGYSQESGLSRQKLAKNRTILSSPKIRSIKNPNKTHNLNQSKFLNILQDHLQESGAKERILQPQKNVKHPKKSVKKSEHSVLDILKPPSIQNHQLRSAHYDGGKKGILGSNPNPKNIKKSNKLVDIHKPPIFSKPHSNSDKNAKHSANNNIRKNSGKLFVSQDSSAKNILSARMMANKTKSNSLSNSNLRVRHHGQQQNNSHLVQKKTKTRLDKNLKSNKKNIQLSAFSKQKSVQKNSPRQRTSPQLSHASHLKKKNISVNNNLNKTIPVFKNINSKKNLSQTNKKERIFFREVNYPELNQKLRSYPVKKKEPHPSKSRRLEPSLHQKSQPIKISRKANASLWQNGAWSLSKSKPIHKYLKKIPTHLAQLPEQKQPKNRQLVNTNIKRSSTKESPAVPHLILAPKENPSTSKPVPVAAKSNSGTKSSHPNAISSSSHENKIPPYSHLEQTDQTFDIFAIKPKSSDGKKTAKVNDSMSYDSSREMYINLPPEDYGINEELPDIEQFFVQIFPKPEVFQRISEVPPFVRINVIPLNILIYGLDSLSHLSFQRKLPHTYKYLKDTLNAITMNGYNIVGDATTAAIIPLLTGKTETELPEVRKNQLASGFVDDYPLIWNKFRSKGYATLFAEDSPSLAVFNLRFNGFYTAPTDHYMRPFWQAVSESVLHERSLNFCLGSKPKHQFTLDYVMDFFQKYNNVSKFAFAFHGELSHNDNNPVQYLDKDLVHFLQQMKQHNFLNNTLLIVMSDHGARYSNVRNTVQGKLEERLPYMSFVFPPWFHQKYPYFINNLKGNREKLVTPFDVHETMLDLLDTSRMYEPIDYSTRGISLLQSVPFNRTCASAGIAMHWCSCLTRFDVNPSTPLVQMSLHKILSYIRTLLLPVKHLCAELSLKKIIYAYLVTPNEKVLKFTNSKDADNRVANFSQHMLLDTVHYQLTFETYPNGGLYEASVQVDIRKESFQVFPEISRLNKYGDQPSCIKEIFPDLRKYCYCKIR